MRAYHKSRGDAKRIKMLIPDSAHGTNPASAGMIGLQIVQIPSDARGNVDLEALKAACDDTVVGMMLTNPNTLGLFDEHIEEIIQTRPRLRRPDVRRRRQPERPAGHRPPGDLGFDLMHFNLHKTFAVPHGGGGPGSGPVGVAAHLADFLPAPLVGDRGRRRRRNPAALRLRQTRQKSIGRMKAFHGHFGGGLVRAFTYIAMHGPDGLKDISQYAVLNANYLLARLRNTYHVPFDRICMHEFVAEGQFRRLRCPRPGYRQAPDGLQLPPADQLLPAHRPRGADDRADRDREQERPGRASPTR